MQANLPDFQFSKHDYAASSTDEASLLPLGEAYASSLSCQGSAYQDLHSFRKVSCRQQAPLVFEVALRR